jgi:hypothetical protein
MILALNVIFVVVVALVTFTTFVGAILASKDIEGNKIAIVTGLVGLGVIGYIIGVFAPVIAFESDITMVIVGAFSIIVICGLWFMHVLCAGVSESRLFGLTALVSNIICIAGLIAITTIGLLV